MCTLCKLDSPLDFSVRTPTNTNPTVTREVVRMIVNEGISNCKNKF